MVDSRGRLTVVTGGGSGIGRAIALRFARDGGTCLIAGLEKSLLEETAEVDASCTRRFLVHEADLATDEGRESLWCAVSEAESQLATLVNCAGRSSRMNLFKPLAEAWRLDLETNLTAIGVLSAWALETMRRSGGGSIVNIGSVYGRLGMNDRFYREVCPVDAQEGPLRAPAYNASKGGLAALTRELAAVGGRWNVRVNTVSPGMIKTPRPDLDEARERRFAEETPLRRMGTPEDIAEVVAFLSSDRAAFVTGVDLPVDGGWSII
ncbi:SDR family NAD(P)-dependent oxidoreductase [Amycolatopsis thermoflava]|uniref:SDR family NAD(P)-dependent oxidoreductase n=1 Tax=Amycolatopsis thermoflava TaxID=84480 RepID=UPI003659EDC2